MFVEKGYDETSLQDIINAAKLSKGAIYHYFESKEQIFVKICERLGQENSDRLAVIRDDRGMNGAEKIREVFRSSLLSNSQAGMLSIVPYLIDAPKFLAMEIRSIYEEAVPYYIEPILREGIADGSIRTDHPKELAETLVTLSDIWLHPLLRPTTADEVRSRFEVYNKLTEPFGFKLLDEELTEAVVNFEGILQKKG